MDTIKIIRLVATAIAVNTVLKGLNLVPFPGVLTFLAFTSSSYYLSTFLGKLTLDHCVR